jgi:glycosyltransferase involved in cell wall biosynthesis
LKILYDHQAFLSQRYGGVSRYFVEVAQRLQKVPGCEVLISSGIHINEYLSGSGRIQFGLKVANISKTTKVRGLIGSGMDISAERIWGANLVHETYYSPYRLPWRSSFIVTTLHDLIHERYPQYFEGDSTAERKRIAMERSSAIVCVSHTTYRYAVEIYPHLQAKFVVIPHGQNYTPATTAAQGRISLMFAGKPFILFVGDRRNYKNFSRALIAYAKTRARLPALCFLCFGGGDFGASEKGQFAELNLQPDSIKQFSGCDDDLFAAYQAAVAFIYPSLEEGFGIPILEACAAGCRVLCSDTPAFREVAGDSGEYFDPNSIESISAVLSGALTTERSPDQAKQAREWAGGFSWERSAELHASLYRQLLAS